MGDYGKDVLLGNVGRPFGVEEQHTFEISDAAPVLHRPAKATG